MHRGDPFRIGVSEGDILAGKYRVDRILGMGGMGVVVAARHLKLDERVAIKFLHPDALENAEAVARFDREARAAVKIKSEHVARTIDVGTLDNGAPYMIMEYLDGEDLARWVESKGPFSVEQAVEFMLQACEAMADAHSLGIIHRDLKPSNLICIRRSDGLFAIKVLDFGISKVSADVFGPAMDMTRTGAVMGSPLYMSPEQMRSARSVDARSDIWAIGVILYELLTGRVPFRGNSLPEVCMSVSTQPTPSIRAVRPDVPVGLETVIATCLKKDRHDRYANVAELGVALAPFGSRRARASAERISRVIEGAGLSTSALAPPSSDPGEPTSSTTVASWGQTGPGIRRRAGLLSVAAVIVVGLFGGAVRWLMPDRLPGWLAPMSAAPPLTPRPVPTAVPSASKLPEIASISPPTSAAVSASTRRFLCLGRPSRFRRYRAKSRQLRRRRRALGRQSRRRRSNREASPKVPQLAQHRYPLHLPRRAIALENWVDGCEVLRSSGILAACNSCHVFANGLDTNKLDGQGDRNEAL